MNNVLAVVGVTTPTNVVVKVPKPSKPCSLEFKDHEKALHRLATKAYKQMMGMQLDVTYDDCFGAAQLGFVKARNGFDASRGFKFITYYWNIVQNELKDVLHTGVKNAMTFVNLDERATSNDGDGDNNSYLETHRACQNWDDPMVILERKQNHAEQIALLSTPAKRILRETLRRNLFEPTPDLEPGTKRGAAPVRAMGTQLGLNDDDIRRVRAEFRRRLGVRC